VGDTEPQSQLAPTQHSDKACGRHRARNSTRTNAAKQRSAQSLIECKYPSNPDDTQTAPQTARCTTANLHQQRISAAAREPEKRKRKRAQETKKKKENEKRRQVELYVATRRCGDAAMRRCGDKDLVAGGKEVTTPVEVAAIRPKPQSRDRSRRCHPHTTQVTKRRDYRGCREGGDDGGKTAMPSQRTGLTALT
jgi:hypothetical protein